MFTSLTERISPNAFFTLLLSLEYFLYNIKKIKYKDNYQKRDLASTLFLANSLIP